MRLDLTKQCCTVIMIFGVVFGLTLLGVSDLSRKSDHYDDNPACYCSRINYLILAGGRC